MAYVPKRKIKKQRVSSKANKTAEQDRGYGPEPAAKINYSDNRIGYITSLNWYARFLEPDEVEAYALLQMKKMGYATKQIASAKRSGKLVGTIGSISKMLLNECILADDTMSWFKHKLDTAVKEGQDKKDATVTEGKIINLQERTANKSLEIIEEIESRIESVNWNADEFVPFDEFKNLEVRPGHTKVIREYYSRFRNDLADNLDDDCKGLTRSEIAKRKRDYATHITLYDKIIEACDSWTSGAVKSKPMTEKKRQRLEAKAAKNPTAVITNLKYKTSDSETGLVSVKPTQILGAVMLIAYNARYNVLTSYIAEEGQTLSVKGTTILNYSESKSESKRASRALRDIKLLVNTSRANAAKSFTSIKGTVVTLRGRTSEETILIGAWR